MRMHANDIYCLTPLGERQLRGADTTAFPEELDLLVRVDGALTMAQIRAGMKTQPPAHFDALFGRLVRQGLLQLQLGLDDPFGKQFSFTPSPEALALADGEAEAATASMRRAGYFVRIARRRPMAAKVAGKAPRALVVEDEPHLAKFLQHYLQFEGFDVGTAGARSEVVAELRKQPVPDLVLLDVMLPDADGFDILAKMRQHPALKEVPVIMITGKATREAVARGLAAGADGYVTKPFDADGLLEGVRTVLGLRTGPPAAPAPLQPWADAAW